jgi:hypothetical protein
VPSASLLPKPRKPSFSFQTQGPRHSLNHDLQVLSKPRVPDTYQIKNPQVLQKHRAPSPQLQYFPNKGSPATSQTHGQQLFPKLRTHCYFPNPCRDTSSYRNQGQRLFQKPRSSRYSQTQGPNLLQKPREPSFVPNVSLSQGVPLSYVSHGH